MVIALNTQVKFRAFGFTFGTYKDSKQFNFDPSATSSWTVASDAKVILTVDIVPANISGMGMDERFKYITVRITGSIKSGIVKWTPITETFVVPLPAASQDGSYEVFNKHGIKIDFKLWKETFTKSLK